MKLQEYQKAAASEDKKRRKYVIIAKVDNYTFVKYRCNDLQNFFNSFLLIKYPGARFANVYGNKGVNKRLLLFTWGKRKGLEAAK